MAKKIKSIEDCDKLMATKSADATGLVWFSACDEPMEMTGLNWFDRDKEYRRLPVKPSVPLPEDVDFLAWNTSGGKIRFKTDSGRVVIRVKLRDNNIMDHMPRTGSNGFDVYVGAPGREKFFYVTRQWGQEYDFQLFTNAKKTLETLTIYFPLYQGITELSVGIEKGAKILAPEPLKKFVAVYGTSITQGGCASRPGMVAANILSRRLSRHFSNFGFSGSGKGEPEVAQVLSELDPAMFLLDFETNAGDKYLERLPVFIKTLREKHPSTPIFVFSIYKFTKQYPDEMAYQRGNLPRQKKIIADLRKAGDKNVYFLDGSNQFGKYGSEATVDGVHATDLGFMLQAEYLLPHLRRILAGKE